MDSDTFMYMGTIHNIQVKFLPCDYCHKTILPQTVIVTVPMTSEEKNHYHHECAQKCIF